MRSTALEDVLAGGDLAAAQDWLSDHADHEIAAELPRLDKVEAGIAFRLLAKSRALAVFEELDPYAQQDILADLRDEAFLDLIQSMEPDDRVRLLGEAPAMVARRVLAGLTTGERRQTAAMLGYPQGSVGRYMNPEIVSVRHELNAGQALAHIKARGRDAETIYTLPVIDGGRYLIGVTTLRQLVLSEDDVQVGALADPNAPRVSTTEDAEAAARLMQEANLLALVVVDSEDRVVGMLTVDDAVELIEAADTEDVARQAGAAPLTGHYLTAGVLHLARTRAVWLLLLLVAATLTVNVLQFFESALAQITSLALFIPLLTGTGGNAGAQAATAVVRAIAVGELRARDMFRVGWREARVGLTLGLMLAVLALGIGSALVSFPLAATVSVALVAICAWAAVVGSVMPLAAKRLGIDPAVISAPLVTTLVDATGLMIYFGTAYLFLPLGS